MPSLADLEALQGSLLLRIVLTQPDAHIWERTASMRKLYIRLLDKMVYEYENSRICIDMQVAEAKQSAEEQSQGRIIYMFKFSDHMENCINAVRRLLNLFDRLRKDRDAPMISKITSRWLESNSRDVIAIRNAVEHMDEEINRGIKEGTPVRSILFRLIDDGRAVELGNDCLEFASLAAMIRKLHEVGQHLVEATDRGGGGESALDGASA